MTIMELDECWIHNSSQYGISKSKSRVKLAEVEEEDVVLWIRSSDEAIPVGGEKIGGMETYK